ncbi:integrase [Pseudomonas protegens]|uniref:Integrase n=1 Tax=Pseudomonas protegens TaxID=380021 RepID=A0A2T6GB33_9PSED|nr:DUF3158 family protein [Pseudomonas protegens]PUA41370.1 integrase [Pseudomonas protegens]
MGQDMKNRQAPQHTAFRPLQQTAFQALQQGASLKGLLKPFKGKGELVQFAEQCQTLEQQLKDLAQHVLTQARRHPFTLLPVRLIEQNAASGTLFLRWQHVRDRRMGVSLWANMVANPQTPAALLPDLYAMEQQRITLNMQISVLHSIAKQATECAGKMGQAEAALLARLPDLPGPEASA